MATPWLSVAMTAYNSHDYLAVALDSIVAQEDGGVAGVRVRSHTTSTPLGTPMFPLWDRLLAHLEQSPLYNAFNFGLSFYERANSTVVQTPIPNFLCSSDRASIQEPGSSVPRSKGSIATNWGNSHYFQGEAKRGPAGPNPFNGPLGPVSFTGAPFSGNLSFNIGSFLNGTSSTLLLGEVVIGRNVTIADHRGDFFNDDRDCTMFMTYTPPNSKIPDQMGDPGYCGQGYANNPPCNGANPAFAAARSRHSGGIHTLMADGSARFFKDSIDVMVWRALGSPSGGEIVGADAF